MKPLAIDLFAGLGGWAEGLLATGWRVIGFDIERHQYGDKKYPAEMVVQDVLTLHGSQFRDADLIVASPPCQKYSYMAMPWSKAKLLREKYEACEESREELNALFDACFRIQREASEAAGRHIPMVVENVKGAQRWVGRAKWHYGSYYLWGDVPALMPMTGKIRPKWIFDDILKGQRRTIAGVYHNGKVLDGIKQGGLSGPAWFDQGAASVASRSNARKQASAEIAKIPFALARHIGEVYGNQ